MAIQQEMVLIHMEDIGAFAEARMLVRLVKEAVLAAPPGVLLAHPAGAVDTMTELRVIATAVAALVAEGLRAPSATDEVRRFREAGIALAEVRALAWRAYDRGGLSSGMFDELMAATSRTAAEVAAVEAAARWRARRSIDLD